MIIGRKNEIERLNNCYDSDQSSFVVLYGRRRVGKTFLINEVYKDNIIFRHTGSRIGSTEVQLEAFADSLKDWGLNNFSKPKTWIEAFSLLKELINKSNKRKKVIFIDELAWMGENDLLLLSALETFWNNWAYPRTDIILVICSSVSSWIVNHILNDNGGFYDRVTCKMQIFPFTLKECEDYSKHFNLPFKRIDIMETYMCLGGIPYYWSFLKKEFSFRDNMDYLFFSDNAPLKDEFNVLYSSLFNKPDEYEKIINGLSSKRIGLTKKELVNVTKIVDNGILSERLKNLCSCGFIRQYNKLGNKNRDALYQVIDNYTIFYLKFLKNVNYDNNRFSHLMNTNIYNTWKGLAFEQVCLLHVNEIKKALGINGIMSGVCSYNSTKNEEKNLNGTQVDLVMIRNDRVINIFEMKYYKDEFVPTIEFENNMMKIFPL